MTGVDSKGMGGSGDSRLLQVVWTRTPAPPTRPTVQAGSASLPRRTPEAAPERSKGPPDELLRYVAARHLGLEPPDVRIGRLCPRCGSARHGRPVVIRPAGRGLHLSLSRASGLVVVASTTLGPIGIDVELPSAAAWGFSGFDAVALAPTERSAEPHERAVVWTRKEAVVKALGLGVSAIDRVDVGPVDRPATNVSVHTTRGSADAVRLTDLSLTDLSLVGRYAAAVAVLAAVPALVTIRHVSGAALWEAAEGPARTAMPARGH